MFKDSALSSMQTRQHIEKLIRVSQMYYDEGLNQSQIAGEVGYSRSSVSHAHRSTGNRNRTDYHRAPIATIAIP